MVYGNRFATESGRSKKLEPRWQEPFQVLEYDEQTQNYTVKMDSKISAGRRQFFTVQWLRSSSPTITADSLGGLMPNPHPSWLRRCLNGRLRRCWPTANAMARPNFLSNGKDTPTATIVGNRWSVSRLRWTLCKPGGLTTCLETSFLSKQDLLPCTIPRRHLTGPNSRTKGQLIVTFSSSISRASMTTQDLRIVDLLRVGFRFSLIDGNRCLVSGV